MQSRRNVGAPRPANGIRAAVAALFLMYLGLMIVNPIIAPLARGLGLAEWHIGAIVSTSALAIVATSTLWGRYGGVWGRRRTLLMAIPSATAALLAFAILGQLGLVGAVGPAILFPVLLLVRGLWFGLSEAAVLPNAQAHVAESTADATDRVRGMAALGAAQGAALIFGSALGGVLALTGVLVPLWCTPLLTTIAGIVVALGFRGTGERVLDAGARPARVRAWDRRVLPFLLIAFGAFLALGFMQILIGFLVQDRLGLHDEITAVLSGLCYVCAGLGLVAAQAGLVPRVRWAPPRLIRVGLGVALCGFIVLVPDLGLPGMLAGMILTGFGLGTASPGMSAGASLAVEQEEQGAIAGLVMATNALTFVIAPVTATVLYGTDRSLPLVAAACIAGSALLFALAHPVLRAGRRGTQHEDAISTPS